MHHRRVDSPALKGWSRLSMLTVHGAGNDTDSGANDETNLGA